MPRGGRQPGAGRPLGRKNQSTIEREAKARLEFERLEHATKAEEAVSGMVIARAAGAKLAKEVLDDFMRLFAGMASLHQPLQPGVEASPGQEPDPSKFREWATLAVDAAKALAPYQSPRFSAVMVGQAIVNEVEVVGGLPNEQDGGLIASSDQKTEEAEIIPMPK